MFAMGLRVLNEMVNSAGLLAVANASHHTFLDRLQGRWKKRFNKVEGRLLEMTPGSKT